MPGVLPPTDDAVRKVLYVAIQRAAKKWMMPIRDWPATLYFFSIVFADRVPVRSVAAIIHIWVDSPQGFESSVLGSRRCGKNLGS